MKRTIFVAAVCAAGLAHAQDFVNGDFVGNANGWTQLDQQGGYSSGAGSDGAAGYMWINNSGNSTLPRVEQTISGLTVGENYTVSGFIKTQVIFNSGDPFQALVDDVVVFNGPNQRLDQWTAFSFDVVATSTSHKFTFRAEVTGDSDWDLDTVHLNANPVPEPVSSTVLLAGLAGLVARRRAKRA